MPSTPYRFHIFPCGGPRCSPEFGEAAKARLKGLLPDRKSLGVRISVSSCQGMCEAGPNLCVYPEGSVYHGLELGDLDRIVEEHLRGGKPVANLMERSGPQTSTEPE